MSVRVGCFVVRTRVTVTVIDIMSRVYNAKLGNLGLGCNCRFLFF